MPSNSDLQLDALSDRLLVRLQLLRHRTRRLRAWRALHAQVRAARRNQACPSLPSDHVHRSIAVTLDAEDEPVPLYVN